MSVYPPPELGSEALVGTSLDFFWVQLVELPALGSGRSEVFEALPLPSCSSWMLPLQPWLGLFPSQCVSAPGFLAALGTLGCLFLETASWHPGTLSCWPRGSGASR